MKAIATPRQTETRPTPITAPPVVHRVLREPGAPLPAAHRAGMEAQMRHDFSAVRIHTGVAASASAAAVGAAAYTVGSDIVFGAGRYQPASADGRALLAHELAHVRQQAKRGQAGGDGGIPLGRPDDALEAEAEAEAAGGTTAAPRAATGLVLQRQPQQTSAPDAATEAQLEAVFAEFERMRGQPPAERLKQWARDYEAARRSVPEAPRLDAERLAHAHDFLRIHGREPPLPSVPKVEERMRLAPDAVGANEIFPFAVGSRIQVTQLLSDVLRNMKFMVLLAAKQAAKDQPQGIAAKAPLLVDLLTDPSVAQSVTATVKESSLSVFRATIEVPAIPAKESRPAVEAMTIAFSLKAASPDSEFDLFIDWGTGRSSFGGIKARRDGDRIITTFEPMHGTTVDLALSREAGGGVVAEVEHDYIKDFLGRKTLRLVRLDPLTAAPGSKEEAEQKEAIAKSAKASATTLPSPHQVTFGAGLQSSQSRAPVLSVGWRFHFRPVGEALTAPVGIQLDYEPKAGLLTGSATAGGSVKLLFPSSSVPMTISIVGGIRGGAAGVGKSDGAQPILGPTIGARVGLGLTSRVSVQVSGDYFWNLMNAAQEKRDIGGVPSLQAGVAVRF